MEHLAHTILEAGKSECFKTGRLGRYGSVDVAAQVQRHSRGRIPSSSGNFRHFYLRPSADQIKPIHITEVDLFYSASTDQCLTKQRAP